MNTITSRIKLIGLILSLIITLLILATIYLNQKSKYDGYVVNLAGKERMLTQKMVKELFLGFVTPHFSFNDYYHAKNEFIQNLNDLKKGNPHHYITPPPSQEISNNLLAIEQKSQAFFHLCEQMIVQLHHQKTFTPLQLQQIYQDNNELLNLIDTTVKIYANESESKKEQLEIIQFTGAGLSLIAILTTIWLTRRIEIDFEHFLSNSKHVATIRCEEYPECKEIEELYSTDPSAHELEQAQGDFKIFISKVEKVVLQAQYALNESQKALNNIEGAARIMEEHLDELDINKDTKTEIERHIDKSEDLTITSLEEIANTKKLLDKFQSTLTNIKQKMD